MSMGSKEYFNMTNLLKITLLSLMCMTSAFATTFRPTPPERLIYDSHAVIHGVFNGQTYKKLPSGQVVTEGIFTVIKSAGIKHNDVLNKNAFRVMYPGGEWQDVTYKVFGSPKFKLGEEVVLMLRSSKYGYTVNSLLAGKFKVERHRDEGVMLRSSVFPNHEKYGVISYEDFNEIVKDKFGEQLHEIFSDRYVNRVTKKKVVDSQITVRSRDGREPASTEHEPEGVSTTIWLAIIFGVMGALFLKSVSRAKKN